MGHMGPWTRDFLSKISDTGTSAVGVSDRRTRSISKERRLRPTLLVRSKDRVGRFFYV